MNKTLSIGLAGFSFVIEEHAYIKLSDYLTALRKSLDANEVDEVMHDIEIRMVELFKEALGKREVINDSDVEKIIGQIGSPEIIEEQEEAYFANDNKTPKTPTGSVEKQLFRDPEDIKLGGVCAGLAHYTGMETVWMRVIWSAIAILGLFTGISTLLVIAIYIILWIVIPQAKSTSDVLKMKGKPVNFDTIKQESSKIVDFANESSQKIGEMYQESKPFINKTGSGIWKVIRFFIGGIFGLLGLGMLFSSFAILGASFDTDIIQIPGELQFYLQDGYIRYFGIAFAFLTAFIPALIFLFIAIRLISPRTQLNYTGYVLGGLVFLWIIFLSLFGFKAIKYKNQYSGTNEETDQISINSTSDSLLIDMKKIVIPENFKAYGDNIYADGKAVYEEAYTDIEVTRKTGEFQPYLIVKKSAEGYNQPLKMEVPVEIINNKILIPNYIKYPYEYRMRDYDLDYELVIPKNKRVIVMNDDISTRGDDEDEDDDHYNSPNAVQDSTNVGSKTLKISTDNSDSVTINGKKYPEKEAEKIIKKSLSKDLKNLKDIKGLKIDIDDDNVTIKTK